MACKQSLRNRQGMILLDIDQCQGLVSNVLGAHFERSARVPASGRVQDNQIVAAHQLAASTKSSMS